MLRHSREHTYWANKKNKERDKIHGTPRTYGCPCGLSMELDEASYIKRNRFDLRKYLREAWNIYL